MTAWVKARRNDQGKYLCVFCDTVLEPRHRYCERHSEIAYREAHRVRMARYRAMKRQQMHTLALELRQPTPWGTSQDQTPQTEED
jgi:hypothetical protein